MATGMDLDMHMVLLSTHMLMVLGKEKKKGKEKDKDMDIVKKVNRGETQSLLKALKSFSLNQLLHPSNEEEDFLPQWKTFGFRNFSFCVFLRALLAGLKWAGLSSRKCVVIDFYYMSSREILNDLNELNLITGRYLNFLCFVSFCLPGSGHTDHQTFCETCNFTLPLKETALKHVIL